MGGKSKKARKAQEHHPRDRKKAGARQEPEDISSREVEWCFKRFDKEYCPRLDRQSKDSIDSFEEVAHCLKKYSTRTWGRIRQDPDRDHSISVNAIESSARRRARELKLGDDIRLWSFHFTGKWRLWGIRDRAIFHVLWWDPDHQIYPVDLQSKGKNRP